MLLAVAVIAATVLIWRLRSDQSTNVTRYQARERPKETNVSNSQDALARDKRVDALYSLPQAEQQVLLAAVEYFCSKEYHRDSCIHHLITCGVPCLVSIPKVQRKKILADYEALRKERGLPSLPAFDHED